MWVKADDDIKAGIVEIESVSVALGAEADNSDSFLIKDGEVDVMVVENISHNRYLATVNFYEEKDDFV